MELRTSVENITPDQAKEYLKCNNINRPVVQTAVDKYANLMERGDWKLNGEALCFTEGGALVNGQHRLLAIIKSGKTIPMLVVRGCEDGSFLTYDQGRSRTAADIFALSDIPNASQMSSCIQKYVKLKAGHSIIKAVGKKGNNKNKATRRELLDLYYQYEVSWKDWFKDAHKWYYKTKLLKAPEVVAYCMYLTKDKGHSNQCVYDFFNGLFTGITDKSSILLLRNKMISDLISKKTMTPQYKQQLFVKAWNAYICNKEMKALNWSDKEGILEIR